MTDPQPGTPPGWYPDSRGKAVYWDGVRWDFKAKPPANVALPGITPAGWYPEGLNGQRYWTGQVWTDQRAPMPAQKNPAATASLAVALVAFGVALFGGLVGFGLAGVLLLIGLLLGLDGYNRSRERGGVGRGAATAGIILSILPVLVFVVSQIRR